MMSVLSQISIVLTAGQLFSLGGRNDPNMAESEEHRPKPSVSFDHTVKRSDGHRDGKLKKWRCKLDQVLHHTWMHATIISLVIVDVLIVIALLFIDLGMLRAPGSDVCPIPNNISNGSNQSISSHSSIEVAGEALHFTSLTILSLFMLEILLKMFSRGPSFFKQKLEVFDAIIVIISFAIDIIFTLMHDMPPVARDAMQFMILLRLWRVTRIISGAVIHIKQKADREVHEERKLRLKAEHSLEVLQSKYEDYQREVSILKQKLRNTVNNTSQPDLPKPPKSHSGPQKVKVHSDGQTGYGDQLENLDPARYDYEDNRVDAEKAITDPRESTSTLQGYLNLGYGDATDKPLSPSDLSALQELSPMKGIQGFQESYDGVVTYTTDDGIPMTSL